MEILFFIISALLSLSISYGMGRWVIGTHKELMEAFDKDSFLLPLQIFWGICNLFILFILLIGLNNSFWHLPYLAQ